MTEKTIILGLDGLDPDLVEKFGCTALKSLENTKLISTDPPITIPAWITFSTGLSPEELDAFDLQTIDDPDYSFSPRDFSHLKNKFFWNQTSGHTVLVDIPGISIHEFEGKQVSGSLDASKHETYPKNLHKKIKDNIGEYQPISLSKADSESAKRELAYENFERRKKVLNYLIDNNEGEIFFAVFRLTDTLMHHSNNESQLKRAYQAVDKYVKDLKSRDGVEIIVISDHGAVKSKKRFSVNTWLKKHGYLSVQKEKSVLEKLSIKVGEKLLDTRLRGLLIRLNNIYGEVSGRKLVDNKLDLDSIDWDCTEAFSYMTGPCNTAGIWINDDRFRNPSVDNKERLVEEIKSEIGKEKYVARVEVSEGPDNHPDIIVEMEEKIKADTDLKPQVSGDLETYMHRRKGFIGTSIDCFEFEDSVALEQFTPMFIHYRGHNLPSWVSTNIPDVFKDGSEPSNREPERKREEEILDNIEF